MPAPAAPTSATPASGAPGPLRLAAALAALQGLALLGLAVAEALSVVPDRVVLGVTTALFFAGYGALLLAAARALLRGESWGRGPVLATAVIELGVAWWLRPVSWPAAAAVAVVAVLVVAALLHPASQRRLAGLDGPGAHDRD